MVWLLFVFLCAAAARSFVYNSNGDAVHPEFCTHAVRVDWSAPLDVELFMHFYAYGVRYDMTKTFSFNNREEARAFAIGVKEYCTDVTGKELKALLQPLDADGIEEEYPEAFFSRRAGNQVIIGVLDQVLDELVERVVWSRMDGSEAGPPCDDGNPCFDKEGGQIH